MLFGFLKLFFSHFFIDLFVFKPKGEVHCIAPTTLDEYRNYIAKALELERDCRQVSVQKLLIANCISFLCSFKNHYELNFGSAECQTLLGYIANLKPIKFFCWKAMSELQTLYQTYSSRRNVERKKSKKRNRSKRSS